MAESRGDFVAKPLLPPTLYDQWPKLNKGNFTGIMIRLQSHNNLPAITGLRPAQALNTCVNVADGSGTIHSEYFHSLHKQALPGHGSHGADSFGATRNPGLLLQDARQGRPARH